MACTWFDAMYKDRQMCRSCHKAQEDHRICDKFKGPYERSCLYCGQPSELHRLCTTFPKEDRAGCWCDICGRSYNDHISSTIAVEIIVTDVTEDVFENRRRSILTERIEAQWVSGPCHFQVSDK